eukprot:gene26840-35195_t
MAEYSRRVQQYIQTVLHPHDTLTVAATTIPGCSFMGLFANSHFESGSVVCVYTGTRLATKEAIRLKDKSYLMRLGEQCYVDASSDSRIYASPHGWNVEFVKLPQDWMALVVATRDICPGEELFASGTGCPVRGRCVCRLNRLPYPRAAGRTADEDPSGFTRRVDLPHRIENQKIANTGQ